MDPSSSSQTTAEVKLEGTIAGVTIADWISIAEKLQNTEAKLQDTDEKLQVLKEKLRSNIEKIQSVNGQLQLAKEMLTVRRTVHLNNASAASRAELQRQAAELDLLDAEQELNQHHELGAERWLDQHGE